MLSSLSLWLPAYSAVIENRNSGSGPAEEFDPVEVCPLGYTTRLDTAKVLIELEMWEQAVQVSIFNRQLVLLANSPVKH